MTPQRFWLFASEQFYASGGLHDLVATYATLAEAQAGAHAWHGEDGHEAAYTWHHIVDSRTGEIVAGTQEQGYGAEELTLPAAALYPYR